MPLRSPALSRRTARRAFSLVELVIVMSILGIAAAIAVPRFVSAQQRYQALATANRVVADLALARADARQTSTSRKVYFDTAVESLTMPGVEPVIGGVDAVSKTGDYQVLFDREPYHADLVKADFGGDAVVVFDGFGRPDSGGTLVVQSGGTEVTVTLDPETGEASR